MRNQVQTQRLNNKRLSFQSSQAETAETCFCLTDVIYKIQIQCASPKTVVFLANGSNRDNSNHKRGHSVTGAPVAMPPDQVEN